MLTRRTRKRTLSDGPCSGPKRQRVYNEHCWIDALPEELLLRILSLVYWTDGKCATLVYRPNATCMDVLTLAAVSSRWYSLVHEHLIPQKQFYFQQYTDDSVLSCFDILSYEPSLNYWADQVGSVRIMLPKRSDITPKDKNCYLFMDQLLLHISKSPLDVSYIFWCEHYHRNEPSYHFNEAILSRLKMQLCERPGSEVHFICKKLENYNTGADWWKFVPDELSWEGLSLILPIHFHLSYMEYSHVGSFIGSLETSDMEACLLMVDTMYMVCSRYNHEKFCHDFSSNVAKLDRAHCKLQSTRIVLNLCLYNVMQVDHGVLIRDLKAMLTSFFGSDTSIKTIIRPE